MQWLTTTLDQAGNEVENDSEQSNSLSERILNLFISLLIIQSPCFFYRDIYFPHILIYQTFSWESENLALRNKLSQKNK